MLGTLARLLPVVIGIGAGIMLRRLAGAEHRDGDFLFKLVFHVCLPALMFTSLSTVQITRQLALFPTAALAAVSTGYLLGRLAARKARLPSTRAAVLVTGCMIVNTGFSLPFIQALYGEQGVARIAAFDAVNTTATFTWAYYTSARANPAHTGGSLLLDRLVKSPPLYAIAAGMLVNVARVVVPPEVAKPVAAIGSGTGLLIALGTGILLAPVREDLRKAALGVATRLASGLAVGAAVVLLFDLDAMDRTIVLLLSVAPVGFFSVTFASLENLDVRLATSALSLSLVTSLVLSLVIVVATV